MEAEAHFVVAEIEEAEQPAPAQASVFLVSRSAE
jgi:hypothetical protein